MSSFALDDHGCHDWAPRRQGSGASPVVAPIWEGLPVERESLLGRVSYPQVLPLVVVPLVPDVVPEPAFSVVFIPSAAWPGCGHHSV
jgi:hypothetical protein